MGDLKNPKVICAKGLLFLGVGLLASVLLILDDLRVKTALLLLLAIWAFCRFYYFAFYVIEHYVDSDYRFSGLLSFFRYLVRKRDE